MEGNDTDNDDKLLQNALVFVALRKNKTQEEKIKKITKYLAQGANINAVDANNDGNTPLHVAVSKGEIEVVRFILSKGASTTCVNSNNQNALNIAQTLDSSEGLEIAMLLKPDPTEKQVTSQRQVTEQTSLKGNLDDKTNMPINKPGVVESTKEKKDTQLLYRKRSGTSGLGGHLYETKLISLILLRAIYDDKITEFYLGVNIEGLPKAYDDIYLQYKIKGDSNPKYIFLKVQHREDPTKSKVTLDGVLSCKTDFSLYNYFASYIHLLLTISDNECEIIFFTSAFENFRKKKILNETDASRFLKTNSEGKIFQFDYDQVDLDTFVFNMTLVTSVALVQSLCQFILNKNNNINNMFTGRGNLIKKYHVYLAQNVIDLQSVPQDSKNSDRVGKFRQSFLKSNDKNHLIMKRSIMNDINAINKNKPSNEHIEIETLTFRLPLTFGNISSKFTESETENISLLNKLCYKFRILLEKVYDDNLSYKVVKIDSSIIGPENILQCTDVGINGFERLVGNLLIFDEDSKLLKFNLEMQSLPEDTKKFLEVLQNWFTDLSKYRFDINVPDFPKLTLTFDEREVNQVKQFFHTVRFYTNQPKEDVVEIIIKEEIEKSFRIKRTQQESIFRIKCDTIFLKAHDQVQKWLQQTQTAPFLTKTCKFYEEAQKNILHTPILNFLNYSYRENMNKLKIVFEAEVVQIHIADFIKSDKTRLFIHTDELDFSSSKIIQFFDMIQFDQLLFIDLDFGLLKKYFNDLVSELNKSVCKILTIVCQGDSDQIKLRENISTLSKNFKGLIIIVTGKKFGEYFKTLSCEHIVHVEDSKNDFKDFTAHSRKIVLKERKITFQGEEFNLGDIFDDESIYFIQTGIMCNIIRNIKVEIGQPLTSPSYSTIAEFYINQSLCRYVTINLENLHGSGFYVILNTTKDHIVPDGTHDIIVIKDLEQEFEDLCNKYQTCNIHWFVNENDCFIWKKTKGSLSTLSKFVTKGFNKSHLLQPKTLTDIDDKTVIISAEPGMGKSTFLTHISMETKRIFPKFWISKINFLEHIDTFNKWKENKVSINTENVIKFLYQAMLTKYNSKGTNNKKTVWDKVSIDVCLDSETKIFLSDDERAQDLSELELLEINLLNYLFNNNRVALLFDGFDEICPDYAHEVLQLLRTLKKSKVAYLWITSRSYNVLEQLESSLGTFSFSLQALTMREQEEFLQKIWSSKLGLTNEVKVRRSVLYFFKVISLALRNDDRSFSSSPLHLYMISEIFQDFFRYYYDPLIKNFSNLYMQTVMTTFNLIHLYEKFVDMKFFKIRFGEKKHFMCFKDPDMRRIVENERIAFLESHKKVGAYFLLAKSVVADLFTKEEIKEVHEFIENVKSGEEKSGIIERMVGDDPKFVHITFAEYFATEFLFDKFQSSDCTPALQKYVINVIFLTDKGGVRRFINSKLIKDKKLFDLCTKTSNLCSVFGSLVTQNFLPSNSFFMASEEFLNHIAMYMLICCSATHDFENVRRYMRLFRTHCAARCDLCTTMVNRTLRKHTKLIRSMKLIPGW